MALTQDSTGYYLDSGTGQYYKPYTAPTFNPMMGMGMAGLASMGGMGTPKGMITSGGKSYVPFTGDTANISAGRKSMVQDLIARANQAQANVNVPTLNQLFPGLSNPNVMPTMQGTGMGNVYQQPLNTSSNQFFAPWATNKRGQSLRADKQPSMADQLILRAQNAEQYASPPTASELFPSMSFNAAPMTDMGSSGAGRFTGGLLTK